MQVICEQCHNLFDVIRRRILGMGHYVPVDIGCDARLGVACPSLHCVDRCADVQQERARNVVQAMEADVRQVCPSEDAFELPGDLGLVNVCAGAGREDHAGFF